MTNEAEFINALKDNKQKDKAFKMLLDTYQERLYWHIRKFVISHEDADDVLQNTFIKVYKNLHNFKQNSSLHTWMFRIAYNESMNQLYKNGKIKFLDIEDQNENSINKLQADSYFEGEEIQIRLQEAILKLPKKQQEVFKMKYFDDLKFREISEISGVNEATLKSAYYAAVKSIEEFMTRLQTI
ncbi:RNA polymerase sigma-70 factor (ECF subfamily) [Lutibacter oceani]|uniref:RNA polymerase sigma-70 factor (ECF subfamily) n=1 Tax=Lutibacter oceani TaxID=1853311 RepID=A0A3D9RP41_9FLAO|nr:sigma-70 family RNA polymerase sigma factor [Lutibacter oceani]REE81693.1 RNA polymerase sigma-70 factor (ECF subfamily) [Lutibacter oceani]